MGEKRYPTTTQINEHNYAMPELSRDWPYSPGITFSLDPDAVHEVELLRTGYRVFTTPGPKPRKWFGSKGVDYYVHRVKGLLVLRTQPEPELLLFDVIANHWETWPTVRST